MLPIVLSSLSSALVALGRISKFLSAEELAEPYHIDPTQKTAVHVDGDFAWETAGRLVEPKFASDDEKANAEGSDKEKKKKDKKKKAKAQKVKKGEAALPTTTEEGSDLPGEKDGEDGKETMKEDEKPFELKELKLDIPKGAFVAIVGRVGSGKASLFLFSHGVLAHYLVFRVLFYNL
jgi:ATP-binding cassette subfamily C (CFTR/MRP) protein 1